MTVLRDKCLGRRTLRATDKQLMTWHKWTVGEVVAWWQRRGMKQQKGTAKRAGLGNTPRSTSRLQQTSLAAWVQRGGERGDIWKGVEIVRASVRGQKRGVKRGRRKTRSPEKRAKTDTAQKAGPSGEDTGIRGRARGGYGGGGQDQVADGGTTGGWGGRKRKQRRGEQRGETKKKKKRRKGQEDAGGVETKE